MKRPFPGKFPRSRPVEMQDTCPFLVSRAPKGPPGNLFRSSLFKPPTRNTFRPLCPIAFAGGLSGRRSRGVAPARRHAPRCHRTLRRGLCARCPPGPGGVCPVYGRRETPSPGPVSGCRILCHVAGIMIKDGRQARGKGLREVVATMPFFFCPLPFAICHLPEAPCPSTS